MDKKDFRRMVCEVILVPKEDILQATKTIFDKSNGPQDCLERQVMSNIAVVCSRIVDETFDLTKNVEDPVTSDTILVPMESVSGALNGLASALIKDFTSEVERGEQFFSVYNKHTTVSISRATGNEKLVSEVLKEHDKN